MRQRRRPKAAPPLPSYRHSEHSTLNGTQTRGRTSRLEPLGRIESFEIDGELRQLAEPDGPPTGRQLLALWGDGMLAIVRPDPRNEFTKAEAAWAINWSRSDL